MEDMGTPMRSCVSLVFLETEDPAKPIGGPLAYIEEREKDWSLVYGLWLKGLKTEG
jgi:hypothetical protein